MDNHNEHLFMHMSKSVPLEIPVTEPWWRVGFVRCGIIKPLPPMDTKLAVQSLIKHIESHRTEGAK